MFKASLLALLTFVAVSNGQQVGTLTAETHPTLTISQCTAAGTCTDQAKSVVLDGNWRWLHATNGSTNCYTGNTWNTTVCSDATTCAKNCAIDGADYAGTYGISTSGKSLSLKFLQTDQYGTNVGSRVYLLDDESNYKMFDLRNQEFTFDVDMSSLGCGLNGALYFVQMDKDGGKSKYSTNAAGAKYGTGYCDAQCPHDIKFINGEANIDGWEGSPDDANSGTGKYGTCCNEMDIWEANKMASAYTPHVCTGNSGGAYRCEGTECGDGDDRQAGVCDKDGCDFNSYRMGDPTFLGVGKTVDTSGVVTVVTQFITDNNQTTGTLSEIRRIYVVKGQVVANSKTAVAGMDDYDSITDDFCAAQKTAFGDTNGFAQRGGVAAMGKGFGAGMVLVMSIWADFAAQMLWLDSAYPLEKDPSEPGVTRGECARDSGDPTDVIANQASATVKFSNIKYGPIGSTYGH